jgi:hypothetical protein
MTLTTLERVDHDAPHVARREERVHRRVARVGVDVDEIVEVGIAELRLAVDALRLADAIGLALAPKLHVGIRPALDGDRQPAHDAAIELERHRDEARVALEIDARRAEVRESVRTREALEVGVSAAFGRRDRARHERYSAPFRGRAMPYASSFVISVRRPMPKSFAARL